MLRPLSQTTELGGPLLQQNCSAGPRLLPPSLPLPITREPFITSSFQMPDWVSEHIWIKNPAATRTATQSSWLSRQVHAARQASPGPAHAPRSPGALSALPPLRSLSRGPTSRCAPHDRTPHKGARGKPRQLWSQLCPAARHRTRAGCSALSLSVLICKAGDSSPQGAVLQAKRGHVRKHCGPLAWAPGPPPHSVRTISSTALAHGRAPASSQVAASARCTQGRAGVCGVLYTQPSLGTAL